MVVIQKNVRRISEHNPNGRQPSLQIQPLEYQLVRELAFRKTPVGLEIFGEIVGFLDGCESNVDCLLISGSRFTKGNPGLGLAILELLLFRRASTLESSLCEMGII
jgi:hypothetical protein